jgi:hypothetical protein
MWSLMRRLLEATGDGGVTGDHGLWVVGILHTLCNTR